jgi:hypothetical protein
MSVIFRTLKKLKAESSGEGKSIAGREHKNKIISFNSALRWPSSILLLLVLFTVLGAGSLFGYFQLRDKNFKKTETFSMSNTDIRQPTNSPLVGKSENNGNKSLVSAKTSELNSIEYRPPNANGNGFDMNHTGRSTEGTTRFATVKNTAEASRLVSNNKTKPNDKLSTSQNSATYDVKKVFFANAKKNADIAHLVADIRMEMEHGDKVRIKKLFDELVMIKGQDNSYVLKLKAVWHIRNQEYKEAEDLLRAVLSKNDLDLEAGLNMAIVEIKTRNEQNAYRRLEKLQQKYPDDIRLAEILRNLRRFFDQEQLSHYERHDG